MNTDLYNAYGEKIVWTKEQSACLNYVGEKKLLVKGLAGAGKSLVLQALAKKLLAECHGDKRNCIAIFTFSNTLSSATKEFLEINGEKEDFVKVVTLSSYISQVYRKIDAPKLKIYTDPLFSNLRNEAMQRALEKHRQKHGDHRFHSLDLKFWLEEIDWMKDMDVSTQDIEYYRSLPRKGRGGKIRMSVEDRITAFEIFVLYDQEMKAQKLGDWNDYAQFLIRNAHTIPDDMKFDYVLIDEAQDLSLTQMLAAMLFFRKDMIVAMDMNQRIFDKQWSAKLLGIETTTKKLTKSMRTTKQIDNLAESIRQHNDELLGDDDKSLRAIPEKDGPLPKLVMLDDIASEKKYVIEQIKAYLQQNGNISIGLIASRNMQIKTYAAWMTDAGIPHEIISKESTFSVTSPGVKIVNVYNAKGLEFTRVVIPQFIEGNFPYNYVTNDTEEAMLFMAKCRNLIYVAMTRAKFSLLITCAGRKVSRFVKEMTPECYELIGTNVTNYSESPNFKPEKKPVTLPPTAEIKPVTATNGDLKSFFEEHGLEVIDKRPAGGALWVVGDRSVLIPLLKEAKDLFAAYGKFSEGSTATKNRPGWWTKCKK